MRHWGAPAEALARLSETREPPAIEVLACNWNAVLVYSHCLPAFAGLGERIGIPAPEVHAVARLLRIPRAEWPQVLTGVRIMDAART